VINIAATIDDLDSARKWVFWFQVLTIVSSFPDLPETRSYPGCSNARIDIDPPAPGEHIPTDAS
jgi:hypothetical protein